MYIFFHFKLCVALKTALKCKAFVVFLDLSLVKLLRLLGTVEIFFPFAELQLFHLNTKQNKNEMFELLRRYDTLFLVC